MSEMSETEQAVRLEPCPWCGAVSDEQDQWGYLITHKPRCYWTNIHGDPIGRVRVNFSEVGQWNTRRASVVARDAWLPIEAAPKSDTHWLVVCKIADSEPNKGAVLWWYRAMFWRGAWHTARSYDTRIEPTHFLDPEQIATPVTAPVSTGRQFKPMCDDPECSVCNHMAKLHAASMEDEFNKEPATTLTTPLNRVRAKAIVGTVFDDTAASHETLKRTMIQRIENYFNIRSTATSTTPDGEREQQLVTENPFEQIVERALLRSGFSYVTDHGGDSPAHLDFYLPSADVHIEVKTMHSDRVAEQMSRVANVIVAQGRGAIEWLAGRIAAAPPPAVTRDEGERVTPVTLQDELARIRSGEPAVYSEGFDDAARVTRVLNNVAVTEAGEQELARLRQAIGWICDACDAAYIEDPNNTRVHELFNIAAQAAGLTRRLPDEYGRFDETSIS